MEGWLLAIDFCRLILARYSPKHLRCVSRKPKLPLIAQAAEHVLQQKDGKPRFLLAVSRFRFEYLAKLLELGAEYSLDTTKRAKFRPDTTMVRYLDDLVCGLNCLRKSVEATKRWGEDEMLAIRRF